ncbi:MAG TPA: J domain-containing protein [Streptosporangiaceae bacterium]
MTGKSGRPRPGRPDPFAVLGLAADPALTDDEVRAAWRRIATAAHPDRADGGDPALYAIAAAAYTELRTGFGRAEALADLAARTAGSAGAAAQDTVAQDVAAIPRARRFRPVTQAVTRLPGRVARGRPRRLAIRAAVVFAAAWAALASGAPHGTGLALTAGALTWLILTARHDLAP